MNWLHLLCCWLKSWTLLLWLCSCRITSNASNICFRVVQSPKLAPCCYQLPHSFVMNLLDVVHYFCYKHQWWKTSNLTIVTWRDVDFWGWFCNSWQDCPTLGSLVLSDLCVIMCTETQDIFVSWPLALIFEYWGCAMIRGFLSLLCESKDTFVSPYITSTAMVNLALDLNHMMSIWCCSIIRVSYFNKSYTIFFPQDALALMSTSRPLCTHQSPCSYILYSSQRHNFLCLDCYDFVINILCH